MRSRRDPSGPGAAQREDSDETFTQASGTWRLGASAQRDFVGGVTGRPRGRAVLEGMVDLAGRQGHEILGPALVRPPRGYPDGANPALLSRKGLFVRSQTALPKEILGAEFVGYCEAWFRPYGPLFETLRALAVSTLGAEA